MTTYCTQHSIAHYLQKGQSNLRAILEKTTALRIVSNLLAQIIEPEFHAHYQVANVSPTQVILITESSLWSTRMRFQSAEWIRQLNRVPLTAAIRSLRFCVIPRLITDALPSTPKIAPLPRLSSATSHAILACARTVEDSDLQAILSKLAMHTA